MTGNACNGGGIGGGSIDASAYVALPVRSGGGGGGGKTRFCVGELVPDGSTGTGGGGGGGKGGRGVVELFTDNDALREAPHV